MYIIKIFLISLIGIFLFTGCDGKIQDWKSTWEDKNKDIALVHTLVVNLYKKENEVLTDAEFADLTFGIYAEKELKYSKNEAKLKCMKDIMSDYTPDDIMKFLMTHDRESFDKLKKYKE